jgi:hypothetical protein
LWDYDAARSKIRAPIIVAGPQDRWLQGRAVVTAGHERQEALSSCG